LLADRWHTCFFDLDGEHGLLGQVQGRTADDAAYWLAGATPAWRDAVQVVCIDMYNIYASAVRRMLPRAVLTADLFHVVQLAVKAVGDVRRRVVRARYGRRGRSGDPEYGIKGLLARNLEHLSAAQFAKIIDTLDRDRYGQEIAAAWIGKEKLRDALNLRARVTGSVPCERAVRDRLFTFYDRCPTAGSASSPCSRRPSPWQRAAAYRRIEMPLQSADMTSSVPGGHGSGTRAA
jgi:transposase